MPPRVKNAASDWGAIGLSIVTALAGVFSLAGLPGKFEALQCRLDMLNARIEQIERREQLADEWRRAERPTITTSDDARYPRDAR